jgi:imidazolonepropionase-like amidohydrolase
MSAIRTTFVTWEKPMNRSIRVLAAAIAGFLSFSHAAAQDPPQRTLFTNVMVWDGTAEGLVAADVLVEGNLIAGVGQGLSSSGATVIDGGGRTLMPGLIDMHAHVCLQEGLVEGRTAWDQMAMGAMSAHFLMDYLDQGFTTARSAGCNDLGMAKAIRLGRLPGPRLFSAGGWLTQTGGHADTGFFNDRIGDQDDLERHGFGYIVDSPAEMRKAARMNLRGGATHLKVMAGGGVASEFDPITITESQPDETEAAVAIAEDYGTYVTVHAYHDRSLNRSMDAGVRVIEHGFLMSEETMIRMVEEGVALSLQAVMSLEAFADPESITFFTADQKAKATMVNSGAANMFAMALEHRPLMFSGGDMFGAAYAHRQADNIRMLVSGANFPPHLALLTATSNANEVLSWSGELNPYKDGPLGMIQEGAYADIILVEGNPLEDIDAISRDNVHFVMKDGSVYKNWLDGM